MICKTSFALSLNKGGTGLQHAKRFETVEGRDSEIRNNM